jgi:hypothetical protein
MTDRISKARANYSRECDMRGSSVYEIKQAAGTYICALEREVERLTFENRELQAFKGRLYDAHVINRAPAVPLEECRCHRGGIGKLCAMHERLATEQSGTKE